MSLLERRSTEPAGRAPTTTTARPAAAPAGIAAGSAWLDAVAVLVAVGAVAAPIGAFFATSTWLVLGLGLSALVLSLGTIARQLTPKRWVSVLVAIAVTAFATTAALTPGEGLALVVPTPWSIGAMQQTIRVAGEQLALGAAPMPETAQTTAALAGAVVLVALLALLLVMVGLPALTGLVLLVLWIVPGLVDGTDVDLLAFLVAGAAWLLLLTGDPWRRRSGAPARRLGVAAVSSGVLALVLASVVAPLAPRTEPISGPGSVSGFFDATGIDQTIALGEQLRGGSSTVMLRYRADDPQYLRVLTLTDFTGRRWVADPAVRLDTPPPDLVVAGPQQTAVETTVAIEALRTRSLPIPIDTAAVSGLPAGWRWNEGLATVSSEREDTGGLEYTATALVSAPDRAALAVAAPSAAPGDDPLELALPSETPLSIVTVAAEVTAGAVDDYERALALQQWLREGGGFAYSVDAPVAEGFDGSGLDALEAFLDVREGYCVHFASAMAVMARTLGIPSRIAIGFAPGDATSVEDGLTEWAVTGDDLHAWPELWFEEVGWVAFEPTPGLGLAAADPIEDAEDAIDDGEAVDPTTAPTAAPSLAPEVETDPGAAGPLGGDAGGGMGGALGGAGIALVVLLLPAVVRALVRRSRMRRHASADGHWRELVDTAVDLGIELDADATPRSTASALRAALVRDGGDPLPARDRAAAESAIDDLRDDVERRRYGPPESHGGGTASTRALAVALRGLRASTAPGRRLLAVVAPRSLAIAARAAVRAMLTRYAGAS